MAGLSGLECPTQQIKQIPMMALIGVQCLQLKSQLLFSADIEALFMI